MQPTGKLIAIEGLSELKVVIAALTDAPLHLAKRASA